MKPLRIFTLDATCLLLSDVASAGDWIEGRVTHVRDIDTIEVNGLAVRLNLIALEVWP